MATIIPFKGIRYNTDVIGDINKVVSPPYDVISPEDRKYYHNLHPNNFVRLVLGEEFESDNTDNNRFTRAKSYIDEWLASGAFKYDEKPTIYLYLQEFNMNGTKRVLGLICGVKICEYDEKVILPHENTLAKPKSQLMELISKTKANLDCVYGLYDDKNYELKSIMDKAMKNEPCVNAKDKDGEKHILWAITDEEDIKKIADFMKEKPIAIADGHHRYETSLNYRNMMREKYGCDKELASDYVMMTIVNVFEKDMTIYPTHRVLGNITDEDVERSLNEAKDYFEISPSSKDILTADMAKNNAIGMYSKDKCLILTPKANAREQIDGSEASKNLELNILHKLILERSLGIDGEKLRNQTHIIYTRELDEAFYLVDSGKRTAAFIINPIPVKAVLDIAGAGEKMPQKATYFYPKLLSGIVMRNMD